MIHEEQVGTYFITVRSTNGSCKFTVVDDATGWRMTGGEPKPCSRARAAARRIVMRRRSKKGSSLRGAGRGYCIADMTGYRGDTVGTKTSARKMLTREVRDALKDCRRRYKSCTQTGSASSGDVKIRIGGRQGYHLWNRFLITNC